MPKYRGGIAIRRRADRRGLVDDHAVDAQNLLQPMFPLPQLVVGFQPDEDARAGRDVRQKKNVQADMR